MPHKDPVQAAEYHRQYRLKNIEHIKQLKAQWSADPIVKQARRERHLFTEYRLSIEAWNDMLRNQGYACAICHTLFDLSDTRSIYVDHNHQTGAVSRLAMQWLQQWYWLSKR